MSDSTPDGMLRLVPGATPPATHPATEGGQPVDGLTIAVSQPREATVVVRVLGELDLMSAPRCSRILASAVRTVAPASRHGGDAARGRVVCDVDGVDFISASGLGMLVAAADDAAELDVDLVVVATTRPVLRPMAVTGLDRHLTLASRLDEAVDRY